MRTLTDAEWVEAEAQWRAVYGRAPSRWLHVRRWRARMGLMTDFVIADPSEAARVSESSPSDPAFEWFEAKWIDNFQVAILSAAAFGRPFDPSVPLPRSLLLGLVVGDGDGPAVFPLPPALIERLASLDSKELDDVAARWAADPSSGLSPDGTSFAVRGLGALCRRARVRGKAVLLVMTF